MTFPEDQTSRPGRRKSDLTLLGSSSQELDDKVYTLTFGVDLADISFEGLHNYSVSITCMDTKSRLSETLASVLKIGLQTQTFNLSIEGGPVYPFSITSKTLDLSNTELDQGIIDAVGKAIAWVKGEVKAEGERPNRRHIPITLLSDKIAVSLLMSSISTLIGGASKCHKTVMTEKRHLFRSKEGYTQVMYDTLREELDEFTEVAINRCVNYYLEG